MDTLRDKVFLDELWKAGKAPWHVEEIEKNKAKAAMLNSTPH